VYTDPLYDAIAVPQWVEDLLTTEPFRRLTGVSLSDVPGELLFGHSFPSRLEHSRGVYHLARLARPRDRAIQAAALAHDLGHGPFSHLTEPLMIERLGFDHETRSAHLLDRVCRAMSGAATRRLAWLDCDEVARLMLGAGADGRGKLINGLLDYDNIDNVARFLLAGDLGDLQYDPRELARALRFSPPGDDMNDDADGDGTTSGAVTLAPQAEPDALGWRADRAIVYRYLHEGHRNLAAHGMLRKAVDLAAQRERIGDGFFDLTDAGAIQALLSISVGGVARLVEQVLVGAVYPCIWEAEAPGETAGAEQIGRIFDATGNWRERLALEERLAAEAGLPPDQVVIEVISSKAQRALPPLAAPQTTLQTRALRYFAAPTTPRRVLHLFAPEGLARDYLRRLRMATERTFAALGATPRFVPWDR